MKVIVKARHMKMTDALHSYVEKKLIEPLRHVNDSPDTKVEVELCDEGSHKECRVHVHIAGVEPVNIHESSTDMYTAIDTAEARTLVQVKRHRDRMRHGHHRAKQAANERHATARAGMTTEPEVWESEVREFEQSSPGPSL